MILNVSHSSGRKTLECNTCTKCRFVRTTISLGRPQATLHPCYTNYYSLQYYAQMLTVPIEYVCEVKL